MAGPGTKPEHYDYDLLSEAREAEVRWQQIRITQFGIVNQTTLTLAVAAIGFIVANRDITNHHMIPFTLSVLLGTACSCIRLADFRVTARIVRKKRLNGKCSSNDHYPVETDRSTARCLGRESWTLLYGQLGAFNLGILLVAFSFSLPY